MKHQAPLVSVICLCYNQGLYVKEALESVLQQHYKNIELIIVDDASTDASSDEIEKFIERNPAAKFVRLSKNVGNCKAFNIGFVHAQGEFIIDLAADDVLLPDRVEKGVKTLLQAGARYGVTFSDAVYIDANGNFLCNHSDRFPHERIPQGDVYKELIRWFFICPPTIMFRREVITDLNGYDEALAYEDFDFWIRSSRNFKYSYTPQVLVKKRLLKNSLSARQFKRGSRHQETTFKVCEKIFFLNRTAEEQQALSQRLLYELRQSVKMYNPSLAMKFWKLWLKNKKARY